MAFTCPQCLATSYHPEDEANGYCGRCHWWTVHPVLGRYRPAADGEPETQPAADRASRPTG